MQLAGLIMLFLVKLSKFIKFYLQNETLYINTMIAYYLLKPKCNIILALALIFSNLNSKTIIQIQKIQTEAVFPLILDAMIPKTVEQYENSKLINDICISLIISNKNNSPKIINEYITIADRYLKEKFQMDFSGIYKSPSRKNVFAYMKLEEKLFKFNKVKHKIFSLQELKSKLSALISKTNKKDFIYPSWSLILEEANKLLKVSTNSENEKAVKLKMLVYIIELETELQYIDITRYIATKQHTKLTEISVPEILNKNEVEELCLLKNNLPKTIQDFNNSHLLKKFINFTPKPYDQHLSFNREWLKEVNDYTGPFLQTFLKQGNKSTQKRTIKLSQAFFQYKYLLTELSIRKYITSKHQESIAELNKKLINIIALIKQAESQNITISHDIKQIIQEAFTVIKNKTNQQYTLMFYIITLEIEFEYLAITNCLKT